MQNQSELSRSVQRGGDRVAAVGNKQEISRKEAAMQSDGAAPSKSEDFRSVMHVMNAKLFD